MTKYLYTLALLIICITSIINADFLLTFYPSNYLEISINQYGGFTFQIISTGSILKNPSTGQTVRFGNIQVQYDPSSNKVDRIGDITFFYNPSDGKVIRIGDLNLLYNPSSGKLTSIGNVSIIYNPSSGKVSRAGDCNIIYDPSSGGVSSITGEVGSSMQISITD